MPRRVIVTGGGRGLGLGIVRRLICDGYDANLANFVDFLLGGRADSVTGTVLPVDAGSTA